MEKHTDEANERRRKTLDGVSWNRIQMHKTQEWLEIYNMHKKKKILASLRKHQPLEEIKLWIKVTSYSAGFNQFVQLP